MIQEYIVSGFPWPILLTRINFNPSKDCNHIHYKVWDQITYLVLNFNGAAVEV